MNQTNGLFPKPSFGTEPILRRVASSVSKKILDPLMDSRLSLQRTESRPESENQSLPKDNRLVEHKALLKQLDEGIVSEFPSVASRLPEGSLVFTRNPVGLYGIPGYSDAALL